MLRLGPIVGHTTATTALLWIRGTKPASDYAVVVPNVGRFTFKPTGAGADLYGTAIALVEKLRPGKLYQYRITERGRVCPGGRGRFRTMPSPNGWGPQVALFASCSDNSDLGLWDVFGAFAEDLQPTAMFFIGDQVYLDGARPAVGSAPATGSVWDDYLADKTMRGDKLRLHMAATYQHAWSRPQLRQLFKNNPTYMLWDDHDIRDGWGSWAGDSPTVASRTPGAARVSAVESAYYAAARDVAWHFQHCRNPQTYPRAGKDGKPATATVMGLPGVFPTGRTSFGFALEIGRVAYVLVDGRGDRDLWRNDTRVLNKGQWDCLEAYVANLDREIDAVAFVTQVPIAAMGKDSLTQSIFVGREEDLAPTLAGDLERVHALQRTDKSVLPYVTLGGVVLGLWPFAPVQARQLGGRASHARQGDLDDARDQWCHEKSRPEQVRLLRLAAKARTTNRTVLDPRSVMFVGGDLHGGGKLTVRVDGEPLPVLVTSGIGKDCSDAEASLFLIEEAFHIAPGVTAHRTDVTGSYNFGLVFADPGLRKDRWSSTLVLREGQARNAYRMGGYMITGDPIPEFVTRRGGLPPLPGRPRGPGLPAPPDGGFEPPAPPF